MDKKCEICSREYYIRKSHAHKRRTCSRVCAASLKSKEKSGENAPSWKGGVEYSMGYRYVYCPDHPKAHRGKIAEHRWVAEQELGRYLKSDEVVHHLNGDKTDNRLENLMVTNRSWHLLHHDPRGWRKEDADI